MPNSRQPSKPAQPSAQALQPLPTLGAGLSAGPVEDKVVGKVDDKEELGAQGLARELRFVAFGAQVCARFLSQDLELQEKVQAMHQSPSQGQRRAFEDKQEQERALQLLREVALVLEAEARVAELDAQDREEQGEHAQAGQGVQPLSQVWAGATRAATNFKQVCELHLAQSHPLPAGMLENSFAMLARSLHAVIEAHDSHKGQGAQIPPGVQAAPASSNAPSKEAPAKGAAPWPLPGALLDAHPHDGISRFDYTGSVEDHQHACPQAVRR